MAKAGTAQTLSRVDGVGLSVAALDMLFCALGAVMLIFAMQERAAVEQAQSHDTRTKISALQRLTDTVNDVAATRPAQWAGVQALPALTGTVVFVIDGSGSLRTNAQRRAKRHLVTQYVLQNEIHDVSVVYYAERVQTLIQFGKRTRADWEADLGSDVVNRYANEVRDGERSVATRLKAKGISGSLVERMQRTGLLEKLSWLEVISRRDIPDVGRRWESVGEGLEAAINAASTVNPKPHLVLISDGQYETSKPGANLQYFTSPERIEHLFQSRIAISLVDPSSTGFSSGLINMQRFVGATGHHVIINGYGRIPSSPPLPERPQEPASTTDYSLQGAAQ